MTAVGTHLPVRTCFSAVFPAIGFCLFQVIACTANTADSPLGIWRGESLCAAGGKAITMGSGRWKYDHARQTLSMESGQRLWLLNVKGKKIEGVLTTGDGLVFRRMTLTRDDL